MLEVFLFNPFPIVKNNNKQVKFSTRKCLEVFVYLLLNSSERVSRDKLAGIYWSDFPPDRARKNLTDTVYRINKLLLREGITNIVQVESNPVYLQLKVYSRVYIDLAEFYEIISRSQQTDRLVGRLDLLEQALELAGNHGKKPLLAELDGSWVAEERSNFEAVFLQSYLDIIKLYRSIGEYQKALHLELWHHQADN